MKTRARELRQTLTEVERKLWNRLRNKSFYGFKFRRQYWIDAYIVDFICIEQNLIVELDGSQHLDQVEYDQIRTDHLESLGYRVIRFWNNEINEDIKSVLEKIYECLLIHPHPPSAPSPASGRRGKCVDSSTLKERGGKHFLI